MRAFITLIIIGGVGVLAYFIFAFFNKTTDEIKIIVPEKYYSYIYEEDTVMDVLFYSNDISLANKIADEAFILNVDESFKLPIDLLQVNYLYTQMYDKKDLYLFELLFYLPKIEASYEIDDLYFLLTIDGEDVSLYLGSINVYYNKDYNSEFFSWTYIEGEKNKGAHLDKILIGYEGDIIPTDILIDNKLVDFIVDKYSKELIININSKDIIFDSTFIIFINNNQRQFINNFKFFYHYDLLTNIENREYIIKN